MAEKRYNLGPMGELALEEWVRGVGPEALVVLMPDARGIGEDDLVREAAEARCRARGFRDRFGRHLLARRYDADGSERDTRSFLSMPGRVAEVTNGFLGVDAIELSGWEGSDLSGARWRALMEYLGSAGETDFILVVRSSSAGCRERVSRAVATCGIPFVGTVELHHPTGAQLASAFADAAGEGFGAQEGEVAGCVDALRAQGLRPTYAFARWLAADALGRVAGGLSPREATKLSLASLFPQQEDRVWSKTKERGR